MMANLRFRGRDARGLEVYRVRAADGRAKSHQSRAVCTSSRTAFQPRNRTNFPLAVNTSVLVWGIFDMGSSHVQGKIYVS